ncbi:MAG: Cna B-type domain-containing protein, partial [Clostridiales bacterium]|nr:Cna B-type domain-containing protein [Clostridiales bacterium]
EGNTTDETAEAEAKLSVTKTTTSTPANGEAYALDEKITYSITVKNEGNVTVTNITVADELTKDEWTIESLAPGATSEEYTAEYVVTEADILAGEVVNTATAKGKGSNDADVDAEGNTTDETADAEAKLSVTKTTTSMPANGEAYALSETITYSITVKNEGNVTVTNITVADELTKDEWTIESLAPGATSEEYTAEYVVTEADILAGEVVNTVTAQGTDSTDNVVESAPGETNDPTETATPSLMVEKTLTNLPEKTYFTLGETAEFDITVTNNGNLTLTQVVVTDELLGVQVAEGEGYTVDGAAATIETLAPGEEVVIKATYTITEDDLGKELVNTVTAMATGPIDPANPETTIDPENAKDEEAIPTDEVLEIVGTKTWNDLENAYKTRPETITLRLMADDVEIQSVEANAEGEWGYTFTKLPVHTTEGEVIVYTITEDAVTGYDTVYAEDSYDITNELHNYNLTIRYWYDSIDGETAAPTVSRTYRYGESYNVATPAQAGYTADTERVTGVMSEDVEYDVIYARNSYNLTVNYVFQDGTVASPSRVRAVDYGNYYELATPALQGYTASQRVVQGMMPAHNLEVTVIYVPVTVNVIINEYGVPLGIGNIEMNVGDCFE